MRVLGARRHASRRGGVLRKNLGLVVAVVGLLIVYSSALADSLGLGTSSGFGPSQILGTIVGVVVFLVGVWVFFKPSRPG